DPPTPTVAAAARRLLQNWAEGLGWVFAFFAIWGGVRDRYIRGLCPAQRQPGTMGRRLIVVYLVVFSAVLVRHATALGYLSGRHVLARGVATVAGAAAGTFVCARGLAVQLGWSGRLARGVGAATVLAAIGAGVVFQGRPGHPSRWGHWVAGRWLAAHA